MFNRMLEPEVKSGWKGRWHCKADNLACYDHLQAQNFVKWNATQ